MALYDSAVKGKDSNKYANLAAIQAISNPSPDDKLIAQDTGIEYQYRNGSWVTANNIFAAPAQFGNWVLVDSKPFAGTIPTGTFDISNCTKFKLECSATSNSAMIYAYFDTDNTSGNYKIEDLSVSTTNINAALYSYPGLVVMGTSMPQTKVIEFDKNTKISFGSTPIGGSSPYVQSETQYYSGSSLMNLLTLSATGTFTGIIKVYKWIDQIQPVELASYELVKEYNLNGITTVNETIPWNGDVDDQLYIISYSNVCTANSQVNVYFNGDQTVNNYVYSKISQDGSTISSTSGSIGAFIVGHGDTSSSALTISTIGLKTGYYPSIISQRTYHNTSNTDSLTYNLNGYYTSNSGVTSLTFYSTTFVGIVRIYKLAKAHLVSTNPNLLTTWCKSVDNNTIQIQPGEIEINGTICQVTSPTNITLSGNLRSGLTEAASTLYYLYAVKGSTPRSVTYMFDTVAPLIDRYGQTVTNLDYCDSNKAWFHPTYGLNYRWIGNVYNDSSSNLITFDKMKPGYWESAWVTPLFASGSLATLYHGFGKTKFRISFLGKYNSSDPPSCVPSYFQSYVSPSNVEYGIFMSQLNTTTFLARTSTGGTFYDGSGWRTSGYYKMILKD